MGTAFVLPRLPARDVANVALDHDGRGDTARDRAAACSSGAARRAADGAVPARRRVEGARPSSSTPTPSPRRSPDFDLHLFNEGRLLEALAHAGRARR